MLLGVKIAVTRALAYKLIHKRPSDRFIVSYPRSGSTWLRTMLMHLIDPQGMSENPHLFNEVLLGVELRNVKRINQLPSPRILASHNLYNPFLNPAIYVVRDGRDVLVSYYHYRVSRQGLSNSFEDFFDGYLRGRYGPRWDQHVIDWLRKDRLRTEHRLLVRFEDLKANTASLLEQVALFCGLKPSHAQIELAIEESSIEHRKVIERRREPVYAPSDRSFYRNGKTGQWQEYLTESMTKQLYEVSKSALELSGYL